MPADLTKTKKELIGELEAARGRIAELEAAEVEWKKLNESLADREKELSLVYDNAPVLMFLVDEDRRIRRANKVAREECGGDREIIGMRGGGGVAVHPFAGRPPGVRFWSCMRGVRRAQHGARDPSNRNTPPQGRAGGGP